MRALFLILALAPGLACQNPERRANTDAASASPRAAQPAPSFPSPTVRTPQELLSDPIFQVLKLGSPRAEVERRLGECEHPVRRQPELTCRYAGRGLSVDYRAGRVIQFSLYRAGRAFGASQTARYAGADWALGQGLKLGAPVSTFSVLGAPSQTLYPLGDPHNPDGSERVEVWEYRAQQVSLVLDQLPDGARVVGALHVPVAPARAQPAGSR